MALHLAFPCPSCCDLPGNTLVQLLDQDQFFNRHIAPRTLERMDVFAVKH